MRLCDRVTVMRAGRVVHECAIAEASIEGLAEAMVGRKVQHGPPRRTVEVAPGAVAAAGAAASTCPRRDAGGRAWPVSTSRLRAGEIVGVAGVAGNGQSELLDVLSGLRAPRPAARLAVAVPKSSNPRRWLEPRAARRGLGLAHVPEDRHARAMVMSFAAWESAVLGYEGLPAYSTRGGWMLHRRHARGITEGH